MHLQQKKPHKRHTKVAQTRTDSQKSRTGMGEIRNLTLLRRAASFFTGETK